MYIFFTKRLGTLKKHAHKFLFGMRLTTILLAATMLQVSAATFGQKITYEKKETTLAEVFKVIKSQTGYNVVWYEGDLDVSRVINVSFKDASLNEVMQQILKGLPLTYEISNQTIIIKAKPVPSFFPKSSSNNKIDVHGIVTDEKGNPLPGTTIKIKNSNIATVTNTNGEFALKGIDENAILSIFFVGYEPTEIPAAHDLGKITLVPSTSKLDEVKINAGYYSTTDRERTGDISKITSATIEHQPINNPLQALEGRVPGLQVTQLTGVPGGGFSIQIRGRNSINTQITNDPLYIIDGVNYPSIRISSSNSSPSNLVSGGTNPLSMINPGDIESIEVLKDADATAIYGSRGANGVILITTKKGKAGETKLTAGVQQGFSQVAHHLDMLNTQQYVQMRKEAFKNDGLTPSTLDYDVNGTWDQIDIPIGKQN